jgi:hypothetical protein
MIEMIKDLKTSITTLSGYVDLEVTAIETIVSNLPDAGALTTLINAMNTIDNFIDGANLEKLTGDADGGTHSYPDSLADDSVLAYIMSKGDPATKTSYNNTTDSLEAISDKIDTIDDYIDGAALEKLTSAADGTDEYPAAVANDSVFAKILSKSNPAASNSYNNTTDSLEALSDAIAYIKNNLVVATGTFTTSSATVPADTTLGASKTTNDYYKGCILMPLTGDCAFQPRKIVGYTGTTGVFTIDTETPFTAATGAVTYVVLAAVKDTGLNTIVPASPVAGSLYDILSKAAGGNTFDKATDSLEALSEAIAANAAKLTQSAGLYLVGTCTTGASTTAIASTELAGFGDKYFSNKYYMMVIKDAGGASAAPELQIRKITDYTSSTGAFTTDAFANQVDVGDELAIIHESLVMLGRNDANNVFDSSTVAANADGSVLERLEYIQSNVVLYTGTFTTSSATVPADTTLGAAKTTNDYYNGCLLMPLAGDCAYQPRRIAGYAGTTGVFTLETETPFTAATGAVAYVILADQHTPGVAAIQADLGNPSARTNLQTIQAMLGNPDTAAQSIWDALCGGGGIASFPNAAAPANDVSIAEVLRAVFDRLIGDGTNTNTNARLGKKVTRAAADIFDGTQVPLFTVSGGRVLVTVLSAEVTTAALDASGSNTQFKTNPTVGTDAVMCAVLDINGDQEGTIYSITGEPGTAMTGGSGGGANTMISPWIVPEGTIDIESAADVGTGGAKGACELWYIPLDDGASVAST